MREKIIKVFVYFLAGWFVTGVVQASFPTSLDSLSQGTSGDVITTAKWNYFINAVNSLEDKLGIDNSTNATSTDYLLKSTSSANPGHTHTGASLSSIDISGDTNLTVTATGIELSSDAIALTSGYEIPKTASTSNWETAYTLSSTALVDADFSSNGVMFRSASGSYTTYTTSTLAINLDNIINGTTYKLLTATKDGYIDQSVISGASPNFTNANMTGNISVWTNNSGYLTSIGGLTLNDLGDVVLSSTTTGDIIYLKSDGNWGNIATSSLGIISSSVSTLNELTDVVLTSTTTGDLLYLKSDGNWGNIASSSLGMITTNVAEGTKLYYTDARARASLSSSLLGLTYTSASGVFSGTAGYEMLATASTTNWNTAYTDRLKWDGGATDLVAATGRTSLGLGTMALLPNTGSSTITTLGTIATGVWNSDDIGIAYGGTATSTWTTGGIVYYNGTTLSQRPDKLFWDNTNNRLGLGTTTPVEVLDINGNISLTGDFYSQGYSVFMNVGANLSFYDNGGNDSGNIYGGTNLLSFAGGSGSDHLIINNNGNVGIGSTTPNYLFSVGNKFGVNSAGSISGATWTGVDIDISDYTNLTAGTGLTLTDDSMAFNTLMGTIANAATTTGNLLVASTTAGWISLPIGTDNYVLTASSTAANGIAWQAGAAGSGTMGGSGTINYLSKFTAATTLGNSLLFDDGTNVGIGTTTPTNLLTLHKSSGDPIIDFGIGNSTKWVMGVDDDDSDKFKIEYGTLLDGATSTLTILNNGNVGIGTSSPTATFETRKTSYFDKVFYYNGSTYTNNTAEASRSFGTGISLLTGTTTYSYLGKESTFSTIYYRGSVGGAGVTLTAEYWDGAAWTALSVTDGTTNLSATGAITFTIPGDWAKTTVNSSTFYWVRLGTSSTPSTNPTAQVLLPDSGPTFQIFGNYNDIVSAPALYVGASGFVGILTTADSGSSINLGGSTYSTGYFGTASYIYSRQGLSSTSTDGFYLNNYTPATAASPVKMSPRLKLNGYGWDTDDVASRGTDWKIEDLPISSATVTSNLIFGNSYNSGAYSNLFVMNSDGYLGIGTSTPFELLHIYGTGTETTLGSLGTNIRLQTESTTANSGNEISFQGISTASVNTGVYAAISAPITSNSSTGTYGYLSFSTKAASTTAALSERMRIDNNGNVGIGSSTPNFLLSIGNWFSLDSVGAFIGKSITALTSLRLPWGSAPTVDDEGEIAVDGEQLVIDSQYDAVQVFSPTSTKSFVITDPANASSTMPIWKVPYGVTVTRIDCIVDPFLVADQVSIKLDVWEGNGTADSTTTVDALITCVPQGARDDGSFTNPTIDLGDWVGFALSSASGTPSALTATISYKVIRE